MRLKNYALTLAFCVAWALAMAASPTLGAVVAGILAAWAADFWLPRKSQ